MGYRRLFLLIVCLTEALHGAAAQPKNDVASTGPRAELIQCERIGLTACPRPFDASLPPAADMLSWDRQARAIGFRNTYRLYENGEELLPPSWIEQSVTWTKAKGSVTPATPEGQYGYQWWFGGVDAKRRNAERAMHTAKQTFWAEGIYGQAIAINPVENVVLVQWSTWQEAETPASLYEEQALLFDAIVHALGSRDSKLLSR